MTIAAGFACKDGIVLCADSEYSWGSLLKTQGTKIARPPAGKAVVLIAGAGAASFMQGFFEDVRDRLPKTRKTVPAIKQMVSRTLQDLYRSYRVVPNWNDARSGGQFLIAVRGQDGRLALWETVGTRTNEVYDCACIGCGLYLGYYITGFLYREQMTVGDAACAASILLKELAGRTQHVGGDGEVVKLREAGDPKKLDIKTIQELGSKFLRIQEAVRPVIFASLGEERTVEALDGALKGLTDQAFGLRHTLDSSPVG